jgi:hypothetical protein
MLKTLNFMRKLNKNKIKIKTISLKNSHFRVGKRKLPALVGRPKLKNYFRVFSEKWYVGIFTKIEQIRSRIPL